MDDLTKLRKEIDKKDKSLVKILSERFFLTEKVGEYKKKHNLEAQDKKREIQMWKERKKWAKETGLNPSMIVEVFQFIVSKVRQRHKKIKDEK